jgi:hypothetical protein
VGRIIHLLSLVAVIAIPALGWFAADWSGGTTLVVYWFETLAGCVLISARILLHRRWAPTRGHFKYQAPSSDRRSSQTASFLSGFSVTSFAFCAAHALFLAAVLLLLPLDHNEEIAQVDWRSVRFGCLTVLAFLGLDFLVDLISLRRWPFWDIEQLANQGLGRIVVVHLTLIFGFIGIAATDAPDALFGIFVALKTLSALSWALPLWAPKTPPNWLSRMMNRVPGVRPGESFEESWAKDQAAETKRRAQNEQTWVRGRR